MVVVMIEIVHTSTLDQQLNLARMQMLQHMPITNVSTSVSRLVADKVQVEIADLERLAVVVVHSRAQEDPRVKTVDPQVADGMHLLQHLQDRSPHVRVHDQANRIRHDLDPYPRERVHRGRSKIRSGVSSS